MKLVLRKDIAGLGSAGDVVDVKAGYARNFLLPREAAYHATDSMVKQVEIEKRKAAAAMEKELSAARELAEKLGSVSLTVAVEAGEEDRIFGSVTSIDIAKALAEEGHEIERHDIVLDDPLKELGVYAVKVKILKDVTAEVKVWVVKK